MPSKKKKYNARFPAGRIKKIMQTDEEVGKVAQAVPVIISRTLELFVESLLTKTMQITLAKSAKTLSTSHMKQCILSESRFDFLKDLVKSLPDSSTCDDDNLSGSSAGLSPAAAAAAMVVFTGPPSSLSSDVLSAASPTLPLQTPPLPLSLPKREPFTDPEYNASIYRTATSISGICRQNSGTSGVISPVGINPNFYTESSPLPPLRINHNRGRPTGNHFNNNNPSSTSTTSSSSSSSTAACERSSSPPLLVVDEDYDT